MNIFLLMIAAVLTGALVPLQLTFNGQLGGVTKNAVTASLIVFVIGTVTLLGVIAVMRPTFPSPTALWQAPPTIWLGGLIATLYILAVVVITPKLGAGLTVALILTGQLVVGLMIDHFGAFGNPQASFNLARLGGLCLLIGGVTVLIKY